MWRGGRGFCPGARINAVREGGGGKENYPGIRTNAWENAVEEESKVKIIVIQDYSSSRLT